MLRLAAWAGGLLLAMPIGAAADVPLSTRLCVVPVTNGAPTEADVFQARRMAGHDVLMLPGNPQPVIKPTNRRGYWTIDEHNRFVPLSGEYAAAGGNTRFARDPKTGRIAAAWVDGLFVLEPGATDFRQIATFDGQISHRVLDVRFNPRLDAFVLFGERGITILDRNDRVAPLPSPAVFRTADGAFDLLVHAARLSSRDDAVVLRFDDGETAHLLTLDPGETIEDVRAETDGRTLKLRTSSRELAVPVPQARRDGPLLNPLMIGGVSEKRAPGTTTTEYAREIPAPSLGKIFVYSHQRLQELRHGGELVSPDFPFAPGETRVESVVELPASRLLVIVTSRNVYALDETGAYTVVPGGDLIGSSNLNPNKGIIPVRNALLLAGERALHLIVDRKLAGDAACAFVDSRRLPTADLCLRGVELPDGPGQGKRQIVGLAPSARDILMSDDTGQLLAWRIGEPPRAIAGAKALFAHRLYPAPGAPDGRLVLGSSAAGMLDAALNYRAVSGLWPWSKPDVVPLLARSAAVDVPWWGQALATHYDGTKLIDKAGKVSALPLTYQGARLPVIRTWSPFAIPRHQWVLLRGEAAVPRESPIPELRTKAFSPPFPQQWLRIDRHHDVLPLNIAAGTKIFAAHDSPDLPAVLLGSSVGLLSLDADGEIQPVPATPRAPVRAIRRTSATGELLIGTDAGLLVYRDGALHPYAAESAEIGAVRELIDVPHARLTVIDGSLGTFVLEAGRRLSSAPGIASQFWRRGHMVLSAQDRLISFDRISFDAAKLQEVGRLDAQKTCSRPL
jgi:hypothetical protein